MQEDEQEQRVRSVPLGNQEGRGLQGNSVQPVQQVHQDLRARWAPLEIPDPREVWGSLGPLELQVPLVKQEPKAYQVSMVIREQQALVVPQRLGLLVPLEQRAL